MPLVKAQVSRALDLPAFLRPVSSEMTQRPELSEVRFTLKSSLHLVEHISRPLVCATASYATGSPQHYLMPKQVCLLGNSLPAIH